MKRFNMQFYNDSSWYLIPTILIMPDMVIWNDEKQAWDKEYRCISILLCFLKFSIAFDFNYKVKEKKK